VVHTPGGGGVVNFFFWYQPGHGVVFKVGKISTKLHGVVCHKHLIIGLPSGDSLTVPCP